MSQLEDLFNAKKNIYPHAQAAASINPSVPSGPPTDDFDRPNNPNSALQDNFRYDKAAKGEREPVTVRTNYYAKGIKYFNTNITRQVRNDNFVSLDPEADFFNRYKPVISATVGTDRKVTAGASAGTTYYCDPGQENVSQVASTMPGIEGRNA